MLRPDDDGQPVAETLKHLALGRGSPGLEVRLSVRRQLHKQDRVP